MLPTNDNLISRLSQFWRHLQHTLFPFLREEQLDLSPKMEQVIRVLEFTQIEKFIPSSQGFVGRPPQDRTSIARAFVAKAVLDLPTTEMLIDHLHEDRTLRRICGFEMDKDVPCASRFSRAFAEFSELQLPARVHEALIKSQLGKCCFEHVGIDSTKIEAREKPITKSVAITDVSKTNVEMDLVPENSAANTINPEFIAKTIIPVSIATTSSDSTLSTSCGTTVAMAIDSNVVIAPNSITTVATTTPVTTVAVSAIVAVSTTNESLVAVNPSDKPSKGKRKRSDKKPSVSESSQQPTVKRKRGRPRKGEERVKEPTRIQNQISQSIEQALAEIPTACDVGCKKNSKGHGETWVGYKLHVGTTDGDIPVAAVLTSASVHDSQVMIPLTRIVGERIEYKYDVADSAYCCEAIRDESRRQGHTPLINHNKRRGEKKPFSEDETRHYNARNQAERVNSDLKDNHGGRHVRVKGAPKVFAHLMFGILVIAAERILHLVC